MPESFRPAGGMHVFRVETADGDTVTSRVDYKSGAADVAAECAPRLFGWPHALPNERQYTAGEVVVTRYPDGEVTRWRVTPELVTEPGERCPHYEDATTGGCDHEDCVAVPALWTVRFVAHRLPDLTNCARCTWAGESMGLPTCAIGWAVACLPDVFGLLTAWKRDNLGADGRPKVGATECPSFHVRSEVPRG